MSPRIINISVNILKVLVAHCPDSPVISKLKVTYGFFFIVDFLCFLFCLVFFYFLSIINLLLNYLSMGRSSWVGKAIKLMKIQSKVQNLCLPWHFPKPSSWPDWSLCSADSGPRGLLCVWQPWTIIKKYTANTLFAHEAELRLKSVFFNL